MEAAKQHYQLQFPLIIAMRGPSDIKKREIAASLAQFLHYPLIGEEDITIAFKTSPSTSSTNFSNESPFEIVTKITETQLQLKLQVIINSSLSQKTHVDRLSELADSTGAHLIIVHCTNGGANQDHDYEVGYVPVLSIDTSKPFIVEDFAPAVIDAAVKFHEKFESKSDNSHSQVQKAPAIPQRYFTEAHVHEFSFTTEPKIADDSGKLLSCSYCQKPISGPTYKCVVCDDFILHKSCGEFRFQSHLSLVAKQFPFYLRSHPSEYSFPEEYKCKGCDHYSSDCNSCLLQTHIKCGILPAILAYDKHIHPLSFVIMPFWFNFEFKCFACNEYGKFISYKCYGCNIDLHISCAILKPLTTKRAVLVGVTYANTVYEHTRAINDVNLMRDLLIHSYRYRPDNIIILTENENFPPTKKNILASLKWLVDDCQRGDSLVFYFSGLGKPSGLTNPGAICPVDFMEQGTILKCDINSTIVLPLPAGVTLHAIVDASYSGDILDLPFVNAIKDLDMLFLRYSQGKKRTSGLAICISACADHQIAGDKTSFGKVINGAFTWAFVEILKKHPTPTFWDLFKMLRETSDGGSTLIINHGIQTPVLSASEDLNPTEKYFDL